MSDYRSNSNSKSTKRYKDTDCIENSCNNKGTHLLQIMYFSRAGRFCTAHKNEFLQLGLVAECANQIKVEDVH